MYDPLEEHVLTLPMQVTGIYTPVCKQAVAELPVPKTGRVDIEIREIQPNNGQWWLRIVFKMEDLANLTENEQYKWAGYIKELQQTLNKLGKLVEVFRID